MGSHLSGQTLIPGLNKALDFSVLPKDPWKEKTCGGREEVKIKLPTLWLVNNLHYWVKQKLPNSLLITQKTDPACPVVLEVNKITSIQLCIHRLIATNQMTQNIVLSLLKTLCAVLKKKR